MPAGLEDAPFGFLTTQYYVTSNKFHILPGPQFSHTQKDGLDSIIFNVSSGSNILDFSLINWKMFTDWQQFSYLLVKRRAASSAHFQTQKSEKDCSSWIRP